MNIALWIVQVLLALMFGFAGAMKTFTPIDQLAEQMPGAADQVGLIRFIGISELLGAVGLILPAATRIKPGLTPLAALGIAVIMVLAAGTHAMRGEWSSIITNVVLLGLALFVVWGRTKRAPIQPRR
jgi:putative oxidoreductase